MIRPKIEQLRVVSKQLRVAAAASLLSLFAGHAEAQQASSFTQYMNNLMPYNTASSLLNAGTAINAIGRRQWVGVEGAPSSFLFTGSTPIEQIKATSGLIVLQDEFAAENLTEVNAFIAKAVQLTETNYLSASFNAGFRRYTANYSQLDAADPKFSDDIRETVGTVGIGLLLYNPERYYIGASLPRLSIRSLGKASVEDNRHLRNNYYFSGAFLQSLGKQVKVKPAVLLAYTRDLPVLVDFSTTFYLDELVGLGLNYRTTSEVAGILTYMFKSNFQAGYSYQVGLGSNRVGNAGNGTHELSLGYRFGKGLKPRLL